MLGSRKRWTRWASLTAIMAEHGPLLFMVMLLVLSGTQFLSLGLIGEMLTRTYYETQNKPIYAVREVESGRENDLSSSPSDEETGLGTPTDTFVY